MSVSDDELVEAAREAFERSYAPYSNFHVGAAVLADDGKVYQGCNIENATYGATVCAERHAVFAMAYAGARTIKRVAVYTDHTHPASPCGICRQVIREFGTDLTVISHTKEGKRKSWTLDTLLPDSFGPEDLGVG